MRSPVSEKKTLLVGFDAACWEYLDPLVQSGRLPNLSALLSRGNHGVLRSLMPPVTPVAWSSILTGVNPGKHGIYEWIARRQGSYETYPVRSDHRDSSPIWAWLNAAGIRTGLVNLPLLHPAPQVDGFALCGFSTPASVRSLTFPENLLAEIEEKFGIYHPDVNIPQGQHHTEQAFEAERAFQANQIKIAAWLSQKCDIQVLVINLMLLDHANHTMPDMRTINQAMIDTDQDLGYLLSEFAPDNVLLISDHGSRRVSGFFMLSAWLAERGYLNRRPRERGEQRQVLNYLMRELYGYNSNLAVRAGRRLMQEIILHLPESMRSSYYSRMDKEIPLTKLQIETQDKFQPENTLVYLAGGHRGNLALNLAGREPQGIVPEHLREEILEQLRACLLEITDPKTGEPVFSAVHRSEEIYSGPHTDLAPDLIGDYYSSRWSIVSNLPGLRKRDWRYFVEGDQWYGDHSRDGIYVFAGTDFPHREERGYSELLNIPATLLYLYGVPIPENFDGSPMLTTILPEYVERQAVQYQAADQPENGRSENGYTQTMEDEMRDRLKALGYLE